MKNLIKDWLQAAAASSHRNTDLNSSVNFMRTRTAKGVTLGLAVVGLLLCGSARADISLMNGAGPNGLLTTNVFVYGTNVDTNGLYTDVHGSLDTNAATFITPFTVTTNRNSVLVVELMDINHDPNNNTPNFMTWSNRQRRDPDHDAGGVGERKHLQLLLAKHLLPVQSHARCGHADVH